MKRVAKVLIFDGDGCVLLARRSPSETWDAGLWGLPGGGVEPGERLSEAAQREVYEEIGIKARVPAEPLGIYYYPDNQKRGATAAIYLFGAKEWEGQLSVSPEHTAAQWFDRKKWSQLPLAPSAKWALDRFGSRVLG